MTSARYGQVAGGRAPIGRAEEGGLATSAARRDLRVVVVPGPASSVVATAATRYLREREQRPHRNVLVLADFHTLRVPRFLETTRCCAAAFDWDLVIDPGPHALTELTTQIGAPRSMEVLSVRNWDSLPRKLMAMFPDARHITYGDGFGVIEADLSDSAPQYDLALSAIPRARHPDTFRRLPVEVIPKRMIMDEVAAVRARTAHLRQADVELADFVRGGVVTLTSCETEAQRTTLRAEVRQALGLARLSAKDGLPIVIKPHPRAELGQAAAVARRLRELGYAVRMIPPALCDFPIELFPELVRAAGSIQVGYSSSATLLGYLYGVSPSVELPRRLAASTFFPHAALDSRALVRYHREVLERLEGWDERSPLEVPPPPWHPWLNRVSGAISRRLLGWMPARGVGVARPWCPSQAERALRRSFGAHVGGDAGTLTDEPSRTVWIVEGLRASPTFEAPQLGTSDPQARVLELLRALRREAGGARLAVTAGVAPSTHLPRSRWLLGRWFPEAAVEGSAVSAEELEELLEAEADVLRREPELACQGVLPLLGRHLSPRERSAPPGHVSFAGRLR